MGNLTALERGIITWRNMSKQEDVFGVQKSEVHDTPVKDSMCFTEEDAEAEVSEGEKEQPKE